MGEQMIFDARSQREFASTKVALELLFVGVRHHVRLQRSRNRSAHLALLHLDCFLSLNRTTVEQIELGRAWLSAASCGRWRMVIGWLIAGIENDGFGFSVWIVPIEGLCEGRQVMGNGGRGGVRV